MTGKCMHHPVRDATISIAGNGYCAQCEAGQNAARALVDAHVKPKECFIWYHSHDTWEPVRGTGCSHFVAHEKNLRAAGGVQHCLKGFLIRIPDLLVGRTVVKELADVEPDDIYVTPDHSHCGIVRVNIPGSGRTQRRIHIEHASYSYRAVVTSDFTVYFRGKGSFYR